MTIGPAIKPCKNGFTIDEFAPVRLFDCEVHLFAHIGFAIKHFRDCLLGKPSRRPVPDTRFGLKGFLRFGVKP